MGAAEDTVRGLGKLGGCLGGGVAILAIIGVVIWLFFNGVCLLGKFVFEVVPEFWGNHWRWIVFPVLALMLLKIAREIGRAR